MDVTVSSKHFFMESIKMRPTERKINFNVHSCGNINLGLKSFDYFLILKFAAGICRSTVDIILEQTTDIGDYFSCLYVVINHN